MNVFCPAFGRNFNPASEFQQFTIRFLVESPDVFCLICKQRCKGKSNEGVVEEYARLTADFIPPFNGCESETCKDNPRSIFEYPETYSYNGTRRLKSGTVLPRFICKICRDTYNPSDIPKLGSSRSDINHDLVKLMFCHTPIRGMAEFFGVSPSMIIERQNAFHTQFMRWAQIEETKMLKQFAATRRDPLLLSIDIQSQPLNWRDSKNAQEAMIEVVTTCDSETGFVFANDANYDPKIDADERDRLEAGFKSEIAPDAQARPQIVIQKRKEMAFEFGRRQPTTTEFGHMTASEIREKKRRNRVDTSSEPSNWEGARIYLDYTTLAHCMRLNEMLGGVEKIHVFADLDMVLKFSLLNAFRDRIRDKNTHLFEVTFDKTSGQKDKRAKYHALQQSLAVELESLSATSEKDAIKALIMERLVALATPVEPRHPPDQSTRWINHPGPHLREPNKRVRCVTSDYMDAKQRDEITDVVYRASMTRLDTYFQSIRRAISILERPLDKGHQLKSYIYVASSPVRVVKMNQMYRIYFNYCRARPNKVTGQMETPAMRLGLTDRVVPLSEILDYSPAIEMMRKAKPRNKTAAHVG